MTRNPRIAQVGSQIRARRQRLGLTQSRLAAMTDLSRASINALEAGTMDLGLAKVLRIAEVLGLELELGARKRSAASGRWLEAAATSASVSYRDRMPARVLAHAAKTGEVAREFLPHMATLLEEASPTLLMRALSEVFPRGIPTAAWDNLARLGRQTRAGRRYL